MKTLSRLLPAAGAALALLFAAGAVQAYPDQAARIDAQIRPNFGGLITPPVRPQWRPDRWGGRRGAPIPRPPRPPVRNQMNISVDCDLPSKSGEPINDALRYLADYGTLYVRGTCRETVWINNPATLIGEGSSIFDEGSTRRATIAPEAGEPCVSVRPGVDGVELRGLILSTDKGGRAACVESYESKVALVRSVVRYWGDTAAVFASGGTLILKETFVDARTWDAAVVSDGAVLEILRSKILSEEAGVDVTPGAGNSSITQSGILGRDSALPAGNGVMVRGQRSGSGALVIENAVICGWRNGVHLDRGSIAEVKQTHICRTTVGVVTDGDLTLTESAIGAGEVGVYAATGRASIKRNRFYGWANRPVWLEQGVRIEDEPGPNYGYFYRDCWDRRWEAGMYCQRNSALPNSLRGESNYDSPYRDWWEFDGYAYGYNRDGPPRSGPPVLPPPAPKKRWRSRN